MSHDIEVDAVTSKPAIAWVGQTPWHGLGQQLSAGADLETWQREAGLNFTVRRSVVEYEPVGDNGQLCTRRQADRSVLYRSDTHAPLGIVADGYNIHQPAEILEFFRELTEVAGFELEVAGALRGGKRIWALAKVNREACVLPDDMVKGYVLLSTSFDCSAATKAQFTSIRVVCNNTLSAADEESNRGRVTMLHSQEFDAELIKGQLGIVTRSFDGMMDRFRLMAAKQVTAPVVDTYLADLFSSFTRNTGIDVRKTRGYGQVMELFEGGAHGSDIRGVKGTVWALLNATTEYTDFHLGRTQESRLNEAWFGRGAQIKAMALTQAEALI